MTALKWINASKDNPGFSVHHATPTRDPNVLYVIRYKRATPDFEPVGWRAFVRHGAGAPLKTIYMTKPDGSLKECKKFVQEWEGQIVPVSEALEEIAGEVG
jgi:hypothetical protein